MFISPSYRIICILKKKKYYVPQSLIGDHKKSAIIFSNTEFFVQILSLKNLIPKTLQSYSFVWKYHSQPAPLLLDSVLQGKKHFNQPSTQDKLNYMKNNTDLGGGKEMRSTCLRADNVSERTKKSIRTYRCLKEKVYSV